MLSESANRLMPQVGPGTPPGAMLRRYSWPIEFSDHPNTCLKKSETSSGRIGIRSGPIDVLPVEFGVLGRS